MQNRPVEQIVDVPVPLIQEEIAEVTQLVPREGISDHIFEQTVDFAEPQIHDQAVGLANVVPQERVQQRTVEQGAHMLGVPESEKYRDEDEAEKVMTEAKNTLENYCGNAEK